MLMQWYKDVQIFFPRMFFFARWLGQGEGEGRIGDKGGDIRNPQEGLI